MPLSKGRGKEIGHRRMAYDYRAARGTVTRAALSGENPNVELPLITIASTLTAVEVGKLGYTDSTGYGFLASSENSIPAQFVYNETGSLNDRVTIKGSGYKVNSLVTLNIGKPVYLSEDGLPTTALPTQGIWQHVGTAIEDFAYLIELDEPFTL